MWYGDGGMNKAEECGGGGKRSVVVVETDWVMVKVLSCDGGGNHTARAYDTGVIKKVTGQPRAPVGMALYVWSEDWEGYEEVTP
jgi:hypothetical protein